MVDDSQPSLGPSDRTHTKPRAGDIALGTPARLATALNNEYIPLISFEKVVDNTRCVCYIKVMTWKEQVMMDYSKTQRQIIRKAMAFDLFHIIDENSEKESYTPEEIKQIIREYIASYDQK